MKRITKVLLVVFALVLLIGIASVQVFAADSGENQPAKKDGTLNAYRILDEKGVLVKEYAPGADATNALYKAIENAANGQTIQLLGDMKNKMTTITISGGKNIFIDLNGYTISNTRSTDNPYLIQMAAAGAGVTFYSSDKNYESAIFQSASSGSDVKGQSFILIRAKNCVARFGTPVRDANGSITGYTDANLTVVSNNVVNIYTGTDNSKTELYGGKYIKNIQTVHNALFQIQSNSELYADGAKFYSYTGYIFGNAGVSETNLTTASATFRNCFFYSAYNCFDINAAMAHRVSFEGSKFVANDIGENKTSMNFSNCISTVDLNSDFKVNITEDVTLYNNKFIYSNAIISESSYNIVKEQRTVQYLFTSDATDYANITWVNNGETVTEKWVVGSIPIPAVGFFPSSDVYRYEISPEIHLVNEDDVKNGVTYSVVPNVNFNVKANISLFSNFVYKVYLPKQFVDNGSINSVKINNKPASPAFTIDIDGVDHYAYEYEISAKYGTEEFNFEIDVDGYNETFTKNYVFSIPEYAKIVNENNYTDDAKALVGATLTYIKAAMNYAAGNGTLPYPPAENPELTTLPAADSKAPMAATESFKNVFYGAGLELDEAIQIRFEIKNVSDAEKAVTFEYRQGADSAYTKKTLSAADWTACKLANGEDGYYYNLTVAARDLRDKIYIYLASNQTETEDYVFSLSNYVYGAQATGNLKTLLDALYAYSRAAEAYVHEEDGVSSPIITIGNAVVSSENYVIVAPNANYAPALKIKEAIKKLTGEELTVIPSSATTSKNKIIVNVTTPLDEQDFLAKVDGNNLVLTSFKSFMEEATSLFINRYLSTTTNKSFGKGFVDIQFTDKVYYSDFGAISHKKPTVAANYNDTSNDGRNQGTFDTSVNDTEYDRLLREANFKAITKTHEYANGTGRHTVYADSENPNPIYWIKEAYFDGATKSVVIKSNVNWEGVHFIIDNSSLNPLSSSDRVMSTINVFRVESDFESVTFLKNDLTNLNLTLNTKSKEFDLGLGYDALVVVKYNGHKIFRRRSYNSAALGQSQAEILVVDKNGNISAETPIMWDYAGLSEATVYRIDEAPTLIKGGKFTTIASQKNVIHTKDGKDHAGSIYFSRGLQVLRSNTTLLGVEHYTENEISFEARGNGSQILKCGAAQSGFYRADYASHVTFKDCVLTGQRCYKRPEGGGTTGTYDFGAGYTNKIVLDGCVQSNFWVTVDENGETHAATETTAGAIPSMNAYKATNGNNWLMHWGIGGTNFCKNMEYLNSTLSRFDAHMGLYNGKIKNSTIQVAALTGMGSMEITDTKLIVLMPANQSSLSTYNNLIHLRGDYGSTWDGSIKVKNVDIYGYTGFNLVMYTYANWDFGYTTAFPSLSIENINFYYYDTKEIVNGKAVYDEFSSDEHIDLSSYGFADTIHLDTITLDACRPVRQYTDYDGDGVVDYYFDFNGDGQMTDEDTVYDANKQANVYDGGVVDKKSFENTNVVKPPRYIYVSDADLAKYDFDLYRDKKFFENTLDYVPKPQHKVDIFDLPVVDVPFELISQTPVLK